jgi:hypothetical protein
MIRLMLPNLVLMPTPNSYLICLLAFFLVASLISSLVVHWRSTHSKTLDTVPLLALWDK